MEFPFVPTSWQVPISQNVYASVLVLLAQVVLTYIFRKLSEKKESSSSGYIWSYIYLLSYSVPFLALLLIAGLSDEVSKLNILLIAFGAAIFAYATKRKISKLDSDLNNSNLLIKRLESAGIIDAIIDPTIEDYKVLLKETITGFSLLGIGAEKLTRDFDLFRETMNRCTRPEKAARFLLVAPDVPWVNEGSSRRGLGKHHFRDLLVSSLKSIARLNKDFNIPIEVRFYRNKPLFRLLFVNDDKCLFGYYSESVVNSGENEFKNRSHTSLVIRRPADKPPDREFFGATEAYFNELWEKAEDEKWDFKKYLR